VVNLLHSTKFVNLVEENGWTWATRNKVEELPNRKINYVAVCPTIYEDGVSKLVLISEYRIPLKGREWSIPAGLVDKGESLEVAASRELFEETGLEILEVMETSPLLVSSGGITDELGHILFAICQGEITNKNVEASEDIQVKAFTLGEVEALLKSGELMSKNAYLGCLIFIMGQALARVMGVVQ